MRFPGVSGRLVYRRGLSAEVAAIFPLIQLASGVSEREHQQERQGQRRIVYRDGMILGTAL